jgi:hypothetical protein
VNAVAPGVIKSSGLSRYPPAVRPYIEKAHEVNLTSRLGTEEEVERN